VGFGVDVRGADRSISTRIVALKNLLEVVSFWEWRQIGSRRMLQDPLEVAGVTRLTPGGWAKKSKIPPAIGAYGDFGRIG
jgi:hypothetical protein